MLKCPVDMIDSCQNSPIEFQLHSCLGGKMAHQSNGIKLLLSARTVVIYWWIEITQKAEVMEENKKKEEVKHFNQLFRSDLLQENTSVQGQ